MVRRRWLPAPTLATCSHPFEDPVDAEDFPSAQCILGETGAGTVEIARHRLSTPGRPQILASHYPDHPDGSRLRIPRPRPRTAGEIAFLAIGDGAHAWLVEAAAGGASRVRAKMARAVEFATILGRPRVDEALGLAAAAGRFAEGDLGAILDHLAVGGHREALVHADEAHSVQPGTSAWNRLGQ